MGPDCGENIKVLKPPGGKKNGEDRASKNWDLSQGLTLEEAALSQNNQRGDSD